MANIAQIQEKVKVLVNQKYISGATIGNKQLGQLQQKLRVMNQKYLKAENIQTFIMQITFFLKKQRNRYNSHLFKLLFPVRHPKFKQNTPTIDRGRFKSEWRDFFPMKDIINYIQWYIIGSYCFINNCDIKKLQFTNQISDRNFERARNRYRSNIAPHTVITIFGGSLSSVFGCLPIYLAFGYCSCVTCINSHEYLALKCQCTSQLIREQTKQLAQIFKCLMDDKISLNRAIQKIRYMKADKCLKQILQPLKNYVQKLLKFDYCCDYEIMFQKQLVEKQTVINLLSKKVNQSKIYEQILEFFTERNNFIKNCLSFKNGLQKQIDTRYVSFPPFIVGDLKYRKMSLYYSAPINIEPYLKKLKRSYYFKIQQSSAFEQCQIVNKCFGNKQLNMVTLCFSIFCSWTQQLVTIQIKQLIPILTETRVQFIIVGSYEGLYEKLPRCQRSKKII